MAISETPKTTSHETVSRANRSVPELLSKLVDDITGLFRSEGRLVRAELAEASRQMATGVELMGAGAILLLVALLVLVQALVIALAAWVGAGWASLIVGGVLAIIGAIMIARARSDLRAVNLMPQRTMEQTSRDAQMAREQVQ